MQLLETLSLLVKPVSEHDNSVTHCNKAEMVPEAIVAMVTKF
jgi:hypothetical protein